MCAPRRPSLSANGTDCIVTDNATSQLVIGVILFIVLSTRRTICILIRLLSIRSSPASEGQLSSRRHFIEADLFRSTVFCAFACRLAATLAAGGSGRL